MSTTSFLDVLESFSDETDYTVWSKIDSSLDTLGNCLERTDYYDKYLKFVRKVYENMGKQLGWEPKPNEGIVLVIKKIFMYSIFFDGYVF